MSLKLKKPRLLYSKETLKEALAAIKAGMAINTASHKYHIPKSTLHNKKTAKYADKRPGPETALTDNEENLLVQWIYNCSNQGMPVSKQNLLNSVALLVKILNRKNPFANGRPGRHWYQSFLRRNDNVANRIKKNAIIARTPASEAEIRKWFSNLKTHLETKKLFRIDSSRIFSIDICTLLSPDGKEDKENLCILIAGNAAGQIAPTMIVFTYQRLPSKIYESLPKGWICSKSENGYITSENLFEYVTKCFYQWLVDSNIDFPIVLFIDGQVSHLTLSLTDFCIQNKIELVALNPNSSHVLQPLEVALFSPIKSAWREALFNYRFKTKTVNLLNENVAPLLKSVFDTIDISTVLKDGFETCGLHPISEDAVNFNRLPKTFIIEEEKLQRNRTEFTTFILDDIFVKQQEESSVSIIQSLLVKWIEEALDRNTLQNFKNIKETDEWTGKIEDTSLFYFWRHTMNLCKNISIIKNTYEFQQDPLEPFSDLEIHSTLKDNYQENIELIFEDPLKICVTEMEES